MCLEKLSVFQTIESLDNGWMSLFKEKKENKHWFTHM